MIRRGFLGQRVDRLSKSEGESRGRLGDNCKEEEKKVSQIERENVSNLSFELTEKAERDCRFSSLA